MKNILLAAVVMTCGASSTVTATTIPIPVFVRTVQSDSLGNVSWFDREWIDINGDLIPRCDFLNPTSQLTFQSPFNECDVARMVRTGTAAVINDPGPGGSSGVLTYSAPSPFGQVEKAGDLTITGPAGTLVYVPVEGQPGWSIPGTGQCPSPDACFYGSIVYVFQTDGSTTNVRFNGVDVTFPYYSGGLLPEEFYENRVALTTAAAVPEPASCLLLGAGVALLSRRYREYRRKQ